MKTSRLLYIGALYMLSFAAAADSLNAFVTHPSRAFGYTLGDVLEQKVSLSINNTLHTVPMLPQEQREGRWVTRSAVSISPDQQWLTMQYQLVNAPNDVRVIALPALNLLTDEDLSIEVPAWSFSIAPLLPMATDTDEQLPVMQADQRSQPPTSALLWRKLYLLIAGLACTLSLWLAWWLWRNWREARALPFAYAYHSVRDLGSTDNIENNATWLAMHKAFNQSAGRTIINSTITELTQNCAWLEPFESEIRIFFKLSSKRFFAADSQLESFDLVDFSKRLYDAEKRNTTKISDNTSIAQTAS